MESGETEMVELELVGGGMGKMVESNDHHSCISVLYIDVQMCEMIYSRIIIKYAN